MSTLTDPERLRMVAIYDELPTDLRPALVAGLELVAAHFNGYEPRPGASEENRHILTEAIAQARTDGRERIARILGAWLHPEKMPLLFLEEEGVFALVASPPEELPNLQEHLSRV